MMMVVYLHSFNLKIRFLNKDVIVSESNLNTFFQLFISNGIARIAVPLFFIISGYLFFFNFKPTLNGFKQKFKKRFYSLLVPFVFWSVSWLIIIYAIQLFPISRQFFSGELIKDYSVEKLISTIFMHPIPAQLWFIVDLIKLTILSPLIYIFVSNFNWLSIIPFALIWFFDVKIDIISLNSMALCFFILGSFFAIKKINCMSIKLMHERLIKALPVVWISILFITTYMSLRKSPNVNNLIHLAIIIGLISIWYNYDVICKNEWVEKSLLYLSSYTFFIYVSHQPLVTIFNKGMLAILGISSYSHLLAFITAPILTIITSISIGVILEKKLPYFYKIIVGARSTHIESINSPTSGVTSV